MFLNELGKFTIQGQIVYRTIQKYKVKIRKLSHSAEFFIGQIVSKRMKKGKKRGMILGKKPNPRMSTQRSVLL